MNDKDKYLNAAKAFPDKKIELVCMGDRDLGFTDILDFIAGSKVILSSSLHGLIFSHSLGVPALYLSNQPPYKFKDYYSVYDRIDYKELDTWTTLASAIRKIDDTEYINSVNPNMKEVEQVQKNIIRAMPYKECFTELG